ncbi:hypothetical protein FGO68_gene4204 [Halteria grandinella]|uniref:Uncharacterized protein n=1 Tax=Halteria grandinella TaxID=5974 RepID=A0A8J8T196_HALGN|nr:hypothetical protein FGO68_gene4204 [Halteria grandinella]
MEQLSRHLFFILKCQKIKVGQQDNNKVSLRTNMPEFYSPFIKAQSADELNEQPYQIHQNWLYHLMHIIQGFHSIDISLQPTYLIKNESVPKQNSEKDSMPFVEVDIKKKFEIIAQIRTNTHILKFSNCNINGNFFIQLPLLFKKIKVLEFLHCNFINTINCSKLHELKTLIIRNSYLIDQNKKDIVKWLDPKLVSDIINGSNAVSNVSSSIQVMGIKQIYVNMMSIGQSLPPHSFYLGSFALTRDCTIRDDTTTFCFAHFEHLLNMINLGKNRDLPPLRLIITRFKDVSQMHCATEFEMLQLIANQHGLQIVDYSNATQNFSRFRIEMRIKLDKTHSRQLLVCVDGKQSQSIFEICIKFNIK